MKVFISFLILGLLATSASAQRRNLTINPDASEVKMTLNTTHEVVHGSFHVQSGQVEFDRSAPVLSGTVVVIAGSGKTGNDSRDKRMNKEILQIGQYASILFAPKEYSGAIAESGNSSIQVSGTFTLLGKPHLITVPMLVRIENQKATVTAHFQIPYVQWGLKDPSLLFWKAEKDVVIDLVLNCQLSDARQ